MTTLAQGAEQIMAKFDELLRCNAGDRAALDTLDSQDKAIHQRLGELETELAAFSRAFAEVEPPLADAKADADSFRSYVAESTRRIQETVAGFERTVADFEREQRGYTHCIEANLRKRAETERTLREAVEGATEFEERLETRVTTLNADIRSIGNGSRG